MSSADGSDATCELPAMRSVVVQLSLWVSSHLSVNCSLRISQMLCRITHIAMTFGTFLRSMSVRFNKQRHLPLSLPNALSITIRALLKQ